MFIPFYNDYAKRFRFIFVPLHAKIRQRNKRNKKNPIRNETLYAHNITIIRSELSTL